MADTGGGGLGKLFENDLFLSYLSGAGAALQRGDPISAGLDPITQNVIGASSKKKQTLSFIDQMKQIFGAGTKVTSDASGKTTVDKPGEATRVGNFEELFGGFLGDSAGSDSSFSPSDSSSTGFDIPFSNREGGSNEFNSVARDFGLLGNKNPSSNLGTSPGFKETDLLKGNTTGGLNPFAFSPSSKADLAGLTSQDITQAFQSAISATRLKSDIEARRTAVEASRLKGISDAEQRAIVNKREAEKLGISQSKLKLEQDSAAHKKLYTEALTRQADRSGISKPDPVFVTGVPGYGDLTLSQFKSLAVSDREYISHVLASKELGEKPISRKDFDATGKSKSLPTTAMGAAIAQWYEENETLPPPGTLIEWGKMFKGDPQPKTPTPMTWSQATNNLEERFGVRDATGRFVVTKGLETTHRRAQEILNENRLAKMHPLEAVNNAETMARREVKYFEYLDDSLSIINKGEREAYVEAVKSKFFEKFKYLPTRD